MEALFYKCLLDKLISREDTKWWRCPTSKSRVFLMCEICSSYSTCSSRCSRSIIVSMTCEHRDKAPPAGAAQRVSVSSVSTINTSRPHIKDEEEIQDTVVCTCRWNISLLLALLSVCRFLFQLLIWSHGILWRLDGAMQLGIYFPGGSCPMEDQEWLKYN